MSGYEFQRQFVRYFYCRAHNVDDATSPPQPLQANCLPQQRQFAIVCAQQLANCRCNCVACLRDREYPPDLFDANSAKTPFEIKLNCVASIASTTRRPQRHQAHLLSTDVNVSQLQIQKNTNDSKNKLNGFTKCRKALYRHLFKFEPQVGIFFIILQCHKTQNSMHLNTKTIMQKECAFDCHHGGEQV